VKFIICADDWNERLGGVICLHKLCHIINTLGREAYLVKAIQPPNIVDRSILKIFSDIVRYKVRCFRSGRIKLNESLNTPVYSGSMGELQGDDWVIIYPEVIFGNPLNAKNVVRWFLHNPTFHTGTFSYARNDVAVRFSSSFDAIRLHGMSCYESFLTVVDYRLDIFNEADAVHTENRRGTAYCIRKGRGKKIIHDLKDSILVDDLDLVDVAAIFKRVRVFYSYDTQTALSKFALMCGCQSVVIPDEGVDESQWRPNEEERAGIYYGFDYVGQVMPGRQRALDVIFRKINDSEKSVIDFIKFVDNKFES